LDLQSIREIADRLDGKAPQAIECGDVPIERLTDAQLYEIASGGLRDRDMIPKALPPPRRFSQGLSRQPTREGKIHRKACLFFGKIGGNG
jgi:hypothetical protein